ncbi:MAG: hypothetical protein HY918_04915 [Candidatus Doudnabacteria bacterium]|nr:hypothetical protein [Candidatus Doudnabacteria bacterium]
METKINNPTIQTKIKQKISSPAALKYQETAEGWGTTALYEGYRLIFSAGAKPEGLWHKLAARFNKPQPQETKGLITNVDVYDLFSKDAKRAWTKALKRAAKHKRPLGVEDIFLSLLDEPNVKKIFVRMKTNTKTAETFLSNYLRLSRQTSDDAVKLLPFEAFALAVDIHSPSVGCVMLLGALLKCTPKNNILQAIFSNINLNLEKLKILSVWTLNLNYEFPNNSPAGQLLYCCRQATALEESFGYFFEFPAIEQAVNLSHDYYIDMRHKKALQYLVKASLTAKSLDISIINEKFVQLASGK